MAVDSDKVVNNVPEKGAVKDGFDAASNKTASGSRANKPKEQLNPEYAELKAAYITFMTAYIKRDIENDQQLSRRGFLGGGKKPAQTLEQLRDTDKSWIGGAPLFGVSRIMRNYLNMDNLNALFRVQSKVSRNFNHPIRLALREANSKEPYTVSSKAAKDIAMGYLDMAVALNLLTLSFERQGLIEDRRILDTYRDISNILLVKLDEYERLDDKMTKALKPMRNIVTRMFDPRAVTESLINGWESDLEDVFYKISGLPDQRKVETEAPKKLPGGTDSPGPS